MYFNKFNLTKSIKFNVLHVLHLKKYTENVLLIKLLKVNILGVNIFLVCRVQKHTLL